MGDQVKIGFNDHKKYSRSNFKDSKNLGHNQFMTKSVLERRQG